MDRRAFIAGLLATTILAPNSLTDHGFDVGDLRGIQIGDVHRFYGDWEVVGVDEDGSHIIELVEVGPPFHVSWDELMAHSELWTVPTSSLVG